jgi:pyrroline-5-carboxylate reductase
MSNFNKKIAFVGGGNMAEAVLAGLLNKKILLPEEILVAEIKPERRRYLEETYSVETTETNSDAPKRAKTVFLAVKPQILQDVKSELKNILSADHVVISILAGQSRSRLGEALGHMETIVRVMPNLPAQVGCGVSAITFPEQMNESDRNWVRKILKAVGEVVEVEEPLQDAVTAVSGSGPGYLFYLVDHWIAAAKEQGLPDDVARLLVVETLAGAAQLLRERPDSPSELVYKVATPGGTTEAGLSALRDHDVPAVVHEMVRRATQRSKELNKG